MSDELDFTGSLKLPPKAAASAPPAPIYIPAIARAFFESSGKEEAFPAGTVIFAEKEKASRILLKRDKMYFLIEGEVVLTAHGRSVDRAMPGEIFGEMATLSDSPRSATAVARNACRVLSLDDRQFAAALAKQPEFALMMLGSMIGRLRGMIAQLSAVPSAPAEAKETRVFDRSMMASLANGLGDRATVRYQRGSVIMVAGQAGALMYVVSEGRVAISLRGALVERIGPGGVFGEMALVDRSPRAASALAETDCVLLAINRVVFLNLVKADPTFGISLLGAMAARLRNTAGALN